MQLSCLKPNLQNGAAVVVYPEVSLGLIDA
jgi:hypothetical protein